MEDLDILISWRIGEEYQNGRTSQGSNRYVKDITVLNQTWTLNISTLNQVPGALVLIRPSSSEAVNVKGSLEIFLRNTRRQSATTVKKFVMMLEANKAEIILPIHNSVNRVQSSNTLEIHGYLNISEIASPSTKDNLTDGKFHLKAMAQLSNDYCSLLKEEKADFSDVTLKCHGVVIPAHMNILSARSPVFAAMFRNKMKETLDRTVCVDDIDPEILQIMLNYVYSGKTGQFTSSTAGQLLFAADKYQLEGLKEMCSDYLKSNLALENALCALVLGDLHDSNLKSDVLTYICKSGEFPQMENKKEWKSIQCEKPQLAMEVFSSLVKYLYGIIDMNLCDPCGNY